jgi:hypothetical protein
MAELNLFGDAGEALGDRDRAGDQHLLTPPPAGVSNFQSVLIVGDAGTLAERAEGGDDRISALGNDLALIGDALLLQDRARGGDDTIEGSSGFTNRLFGDGLTMTGRSRGGDDALTAPGAVATRTAATSELFGDAFTLDDRASGGDDLLVGALGFAGSTAKLYGDGFELLDGAEGGNDRLVSPGSNADEMWGDAYLVAPGALTGADTFAFIFLNGRDIIHDFEPGKDVIDLTAFAPLGLTTFEAVEGRTIVQPDGTLLVLDFDGSFGNSVLLAGVQGLSAGDVLLG